MKQRDIIVPLSKESKELLDNGIEKIDSEEIKLSEEQFTLLYSSKVFDLINNTAGCIIDDYEDDSITDINKLIDVRKILNHIVEISSSIDLKIIVREIIILIEIAIERKTGIYFYF